MTEHDYDQRMDHRYRSCLGGRDVKLKLIVWFLPRDK